MKYIVDHFAFVLLLTCFAAFWLLCVGCLVAAYLSANKDKPRSYEHTDWHETDEDNLN